MTWRGVWNALKKAAGWLDTAEALTEILPPKVVPIKAKRVIEGAAEVKRRAERRKKEAGR